MKTTDELKHELQNAKDIGDYFEKYTSEMNVESLPEHLNQCLEKKNLSKADVVRGSNLTKAYVYQIFQGKRYPSRDKIIALAFGLTLDVDETQTLLKQAGYRELYPRNPRDALLLFSIANGQSIIDANELLYENNINVLE